MAQTLSSKVPSVGNFPENLEKVPVVQTSEQNFFRLGHVKQDKQLFIESVDERVSFCKNEVASYVGTICGMSLLLFCSKAIYQANSLLKRYSTRGVAYKLGPLFAQKYKIHKIIQYQIININYARRGKSQIKA